MNQSHGLGIVAPKHMPWECDDKDCKDQWHLAVYDYDEADPGGETFTVDSYNDGDWALSDSMPTYHEVDEAWGKYYRYVADTGDDPIGEFSVQREIEKVQIWNARVREVEDGLIVDRAKLNHHAFHPRNAPSEFRSYMQIDERKDTGRFYIDGVEDLDALRKVTTISKGGWVTFKLNVKKPRSRSAIRDDLKRAAREQLKKGIVKP